MALSKKELGDLIKRARKLKSTQTGKRYTQKSLANDVDKSQGYICDIECGRTYPNYVLLNKIAEACGVSISFFDVDKSLDNDIDRFVKSQLNDVKKEDLKNIRDYLKKDPDTNLNYLYEYMSKHNANHNKKNYKLKTPEEITKDFLMEPSIINFCGIDTNKLSEDDLSEFINTLLDLLKLTSYKYMK